VAVGGIDRDISGGAALRPSSLLNFVGLLNRREKAHPHQDTSVGIVVICKPT
jgi:hypothetical protein